MQKQKEEKRRHIKIKHILMSKEDYFAIDNKPTVFVGVVLRDLSQSEDFTVTTHLLIQSETTDEMSFFCRRISVGFRTQTSRKAYGVRSQ